MLLLNGLCTNSNFGRQMKKLAHQDCYARLSYYKVQWGEIISENNIYAPMFLQDTGIPRLVQFFGP